MNITVLLEVLGERKLLWALGAGELALLNVRGQVAAEREPGSVLLVAILAVADIGLCYGHLVVSEGGQTCGLWDRSRFDLIYYSVTGVLAP